MSKISTEKMENIIDSLKGKGVRKATNKNYLSIWRQFNNFIIRLDRNPDNWEERVSLYCAFLVNKGLQSQTIKSYISGIKNILKEDGYNWDEGKALLSSLTKACKLQNDQIRIRLPIQKGLLEILLFELKRIMKDQFYLQVLYRALFCLAYYGMMRIGELAEGDHAARAKDVHIGVNKDKILIILYTSKTHGLETYPQKIKISAIGGCGIQDRIFCPFKAVRSYVNLRGSYKDDNENFFIFRDGNAVQPDQVRKVLRSCLDGVNLNGDLYNTHSFRIGRSVDLRKEGTDLDLLKRVGRWRSNAVYKYLRD